MPRDEFTVYLFDGRKVVIPSSRQIWRERMEEEHGIEWLKDHDATYKRWFEKTLTPTQRKREFLVSKIFTEEQYWYRYMDKFKLWDRREEQKRWLRKKEEEVRDKWGKKVEERLNKILKTGEEQAFKRLTANVEKLIVSSAYTRIMPDKDKPRNDHNDFYKGQLAVTYNVEDHVDPAGDMDMDFSVDKMRQMVVWTMQNVARCVIKSPDDGSFIGLDLDRKTRPAPSSICLMWLERAGQDFKWFQANIVNKHLISTKLEKTDEREESIVDNAMSVIDELKANQFSIGD